MYCRYCGKKLMDSAVICTGCRRPVDPVGSGSDSAVDGSTWSILTMVGLVVAALVVPPIGLIFGFVGLRNAARRAQGAVLLTVSAFSALFWLAVILGL